MVTPGRLELPTRSLGNCCSIHLSYGATWLAGQVATLILLGFARSSFRKLLAPEFNLFNPADHRPQIYRMDGEGEFSLYSHAISAHSHVSTFSAWFTSAR